MRGKEVKEVRENYGKSGRGNKGAGEVRENYGWKIREIMKKLWVGK